MRIAAAWLVAVAMIAAELDPAQDSGAVGMVATWTVGHPDPAWLAGGLDAPVPIAVITAPDGTTVTRRAFISQEHAPGGDGGPEFIPLGSPVLRIRHVPRLPGAHRVELRSAAGKSLAQAVFDAVDAPGPHGPLRVSPHNPRLLAFATGEPFIAIGPNISWANGPGRLARFEGYLDALAAVGGNHTRIWMASWCGQTAGDTAEALRLDHAWLIDRILARCRERGIRVTLVLDNFHDLIHGGAAPYGATPEARLAGFLDPALPAAWRRRTADALARWGADDTIAAWELFNELDMAQPIRERSLPWLAAAARELVRLDADRRLHTVSWAADDWERPFAMPGIDLVQLRGYVIEYIAPDHVLAPATRDGVGMLFDHAERANAFGKPFAFAEVGWQGSNEVNPGHDHDPHGWLLRQQAWAGLLLGGYGSGMNWWWDTYIDRNRLWETYRPISDAVAAIDWRDRELHPLQPAPQGAIRVIGWQSPTQALVWPGFRHDTWHRHLVLGHPRPVPPAGTAVRLAGMRPGAYRVRWIEQDGTAASEAAATADADGLRLVLPNRAGDRVAVVTPAR